MPFVPISEFELPIVISMPSIVEVQHIDFVFGEREFYHTPNKILHFDDYVVNYDSYTWSFEVVGTIPKYWSCSWIIFQQVLPRRLLKIRGRIFSKEGGTDVNIPSTVMEMSSLWIDDHGDENILSLKVEECGLLQKEKPKSPHMSLIGPTHKEALSWIP